MPFRSAFSFRVIFVAVIFNFPVTDEGRVELNSRLLVGSGA